MEIEAKSAIIHLQLFHVSKTLFDSVPNGPTYPESQ